MPPDSTTNPTKTIEQLHAEHANAIAKAAETEKSVKATTEAKAKAIGENLAALKAVTLARSALDKALASE